MRHNQNNRRSRGRTRKGPNPLTRSFESNGPDVKVRGTAAHIAEKYGVLARDAQSAGDRIAAESYFQYAEHYNRIVAAAQAQTIQQTQSREGADDDGDEDERQDGQGTEARDESGRGGGDGQAAAAHDDRGPADDDEGAPRKRRRPRRPEANPASSDQAEAVASDAGEGSVGDGGKEAVEAPRRRVRKTNGHDAPAAAETAGEPSVNGSAEPAQAASQPASEPASEADDGDVTKDGSAALAAFPD